MFQLLEAMDRDSGISIRSLQVDGGMTANKLLMQLQADLTGIPVGESLVCPYLCGGFSSFSNLRPK